MSKRYYNFSKKFLMAMGLIMLFMTIVYIVPKDLNISLNLGTIVSFSIVYIPWACWYFHDSTDNL